MRLSSSLTNRIFLACTLLATVSLGFIFAFVNKHPTVKMLALSFLLLIGVFLIAEGFGLHIDKALIYMPMAFAVLVEGLNLWAAARKAGERLRLQGILPDGSHRPRGEVSGVHHL